MKQLNKQNNTIKQAINSVYEQSSSLYSRLFAGLAVSAIGLVSSNALALPTDPTVVSGGVNVTNPNSNTMNVNQSTGSAIINWNTYNIGGGQTVNYIQPGSNSVTLNRVTGGGTSQILGNLNANGKVIIVNGNGVFFGNSANVNVGGLIVTTSDIKNDDFNAGKLNFSIPGKPNASIINKGLITAADGGLVALVAPGVKNDGIITVNAGTVTLASTNTFTVDFYGDDLYSFAVGQGATSQGLDENGKTLDAAVTNTGKIVAHGGKVFMTANAAGKLLNNVINTKEIQEAQKAVVQGNDVILGGEELVAEAKILPITRYNPNNGVVNVGGNIDVSSASGKGGAIQITGKTVNVTDASLDARGATGGGSVKIGGDFGGKGVIPTADVVNFSNSIIDVSATDNGNGGSAVLWSNTSTGFNGIILGKGGVNGGNGGSAEISSAKTLQIGGGYADLSAPKGTRGLLTLDPTDLTIGAGEASFYNATLATSDVNATATGDIFLNSALTWTSGSNLTLNAGNNLFLNAAINSGFASGTGSQGSINLIAGKDINFNNVRAQSVAGNITATAGNNVAINSMAGTPSGIKTTSGKIEVSGKTINLSSVFGNGAAITSTTGNIKLTATDQLSLFGGIFAGTSLIETTGGDILFNGGNVYLQNGSKIAASTANGHKLELKNTGWFYSQVPGRISGNSVTFNQNLGGPVGGGIQNAIAAVGLANNTTLNLGAGVWDEAFYINRSNFNLVGSGVGSTIIRPHAGYSTFVGSDGVSTVIGNSFAANTNISGLTVDGSLLSGNVIGVLFNNATGSVFNTSIANLGTGLLARDTGSLNIHNNAFTAIKGNGVDLANVGTAGVANSLTIFDNDFISNSGYGTAGFTGNAIKVSNSRSVLIANNDLNVASDTSGAYGDYINVTGSNGVNINANTMEVAFGGLGSTYGVFVDGSSNVNVTNNIFTSAAGSANAYRDGIRVTNSGSAAAANISGNSITRTVVGNGIYARNNGKQTINSNTLTDIGVSFVGMGIDADNVASVSGNTITGATFYGIRLTNSNGFVVNNNNVGKSIINFSIANSSNLTQFNANSGVNAISTGLSLVNVNTSAIGDGTLANRNSFTNTVTGISVNGGNSIVFNGNTVSNATTGINFNGGTSHSFVGNNVSNNTTGINVVGGNLLSFNGNTIANNGTGATANGSTNLAFAGNQFSSNNIGARIVGGDNAQFTGGNSFNLNNIGLQFVGSSNGGVSGSSFTNNLSSLEASLGSNLTLSNSSFSGGTSGIFVSDGGTTFTFGDNNSTLSGMPFFFILQNGALTGSVVNASAQTFDGTKASAFTVNQYINARQRTQDNVFVPGVGSIFYKNFNLGQVAGSLLGNINIAALDQFLESRQASFSQSNFSYAGLTLNGGGFSSGATSGGLVAEVPYSFKEQNIRLSLLSPAAGGTSPAANTGGTGNAKGTNFAQASASDLSNLAPAAGGDAKSLANLAPQAGAAAGGDCGNNFLGDGYSPAFSAANCSAQ